MVFTLEWLSRWKVIPWRKGKKSPGHPTVNFGAFSGLNPQVSLSTCILLLLGCHQNYTTISHGEGCTSLRVSAGRRLGGGQTRKLLCLVSCVHLGDSLQTHMKGLCLNASMEHRDLENVNLKKKKKEIPFLKFSDFKM